MKSYFAVILMVVFSLSVFSLAQGADLGAGKAAYDKSCAKCHGATGKGDGKIGIKMKLKMKDYTNKAVMAKLTDKDLEDWTKKGGKGMGGSAKMPGYAAKMSDADIKDVVAYIRSFSK